jgi:SNF2 family DNA or RNA helicase
MARLNRWRMIAARKKRSNNRIVLPPSAVKAFLARPREDFRHWKKLTEKELYDIEAELPVSAPIFNKLDWLQKICFLIGATQLRFFFMLATGTGKTVLAIALARYFHKAGKIKHVLVLVPNITNKEEWADELRKHSPNTKFVILESSIERKWQQLEQLDDDELFVIETYTGLRVLVSEAMPHKKKEINELKIKPKLLQRVQAVINALVLDESTFIKNFKTLDYKICLALSKEAYCAFELTGTPFGRDVTDLWSQFNVLDFGETLGETLGLFRAVFFNTKIGQFGELIHDFDKGKQDLLHDVIANRSIRFTASEAGYKIPQITYRIKEIRLPQDAQEYYQQALTSLQQAHGNHRLMKNQFMRLRQISSGFLGYFDDDEGKRAEFRFAQNPKLDLLMSLIDEIDPEYKIIIYHEFTFSGSVICDLLRKKKINHVRIWRGTKDAAGDLRAFKTDPECRIMALQNAAGGYGLNLQMARYLLYYESPVGSILRTQTEARAIRRGSEHERAFVYDFVCKGTMDQQILDYHKIGKDVLKNILDGKAAYPKEERSQIAQRRTRSARL